MCYASSNPSIPSRPSLRLVLPNPLDLAHPLLPRHLGSPPGLANPRDLPRQLHPPNPVSPSHLPNLVNPSRLPNLVNPSHLPDPPLQLRPPFRSLLLLR